MSQASPGQTPPNQTVPTSRKPVVYALQEPSLASLLVHAAAADFEKTYFHPVTLQPMRRGGEVERPQFTFPEAQWKLDGIHPRERVFAEGFVHDLAKAAIFEAGQIGILFGRERHTVTFSRIESLRRLESPNDGWVLDLVGVVQDPSKIALNYPELVIELVCTAPLSPAKEAKLKSLSLPVVRAVVHQRTVETIQCQEAALGRDVSPKDETRWKAMLLSEVGRSARMIIDPHGIITAPARAARQQRREEFTTSYESRHFTNPSAEIVREFRAQQAAREDAETTKESGWAIVKWFKALGRS